MIPACDLLLNTTSTAVVPYIDLKLSSWGSFLMTDLLRLLHLCIHANVGSITSLLVLQLNWLLLLKDYARFTVKKSKKSIVFNKGAGIEFKVYGVYIGLFMYIVSSPFVGYFFDHF